MSQVEVRERTERAGASRQAGAVLPEGPGIEVFLTKWVKKIWYLFRSPRSAWRSFAGRMRAFRMELEKEIVLEEMREELLKD